MLLPSMGLSAHQSVGTSLNNFFAFLLNIGEPLGALKTLVTMVISTYTMGCPEISYQRVVLIM